jgi:hypothetical protein
MSNATRSLQSVASPVWIRGLGALLLVVMGGAVGWALWIAAINFTRIGV